jgi:CheY-like chemotaxis protein
MNNPDPTADDQRRTHQDGAHLPDRPTAFPAGRQDPAPAELSTGPFRPEGDPTPGPAAGPAAGDGPVLADLAGHPRYLLLERLGSGGMGTVYKALHRLMHRVVALKVINPDLVGRPDMVERFYREMRAAARLCHPNIVAAYDADRAGDTHFLVMEYVEGVSLNQVLDDQEVLPPARACDFARQAALGLQHAFERGMVHRDIKPHNLMLTPQGLIKILDFGLARFVSEVILPAPAGTALPPAPEPSGGETAGLWGPGGPAEGLTSCSRLLGTVDYLAPEGAVDPRRADIRADVYSLGCTLYRALAGQVPFPGGTAAAKVKGHLERDPPPLAELRADLPAGLVPVVGQMMAKDPAARYQTPAEVARALAPFAAVGPRHVLVVEDDRVARQAVAWALEGVGYRVTQAANGREALDWLRGGPRPDLIILDLLMPVMDGWEFLNEQRRDPALATIPVMVVSGADPASAREAVLSAAACLRKPVELEELEAKVSRLTGHG